MNGTARFNNINKSKDTQGTKILSFRLQLSIKWSINLKIILYKILLHQCIHNVNCYTVFLRPKWERCLLLFSNYILTIDFLFQYLTGFR